MRVCLLGTAVNTRIPGTRYRGCICLCESPAVCAYIPLLLLLPLLLLFVMDFGSVMSSDILWRHAIDGVRGTGYCLSIGQTRGTAELALYSRRPSRPLFLQAHVGKGGSSLGCFWLLPACSDYYCIHQVLAIGYWQRAYCLRVRTTEPTSINNSCCQ